MNIFVGNLNYATSEEAVRELFQRYGRVEGVKLIKSRETGRSRGFGFVFMPDDKEALRAVEANDGVELDGRPIKVAEAPSKSERSSARSGGGDRW